MRVLTNDEVAGFVQEGRQLSEREGTAILDRFKRSQPHLYRAIFGDLSDGVAEENLDMTNLFLDLCFDIIFVYEKAFGSAPTKSRGKDWFNKKVALLDAELKSISDDNSMSSKFKRRLSNRFVKRSVDAGIQLELLKYLDVQVRNYANFENSRKKAVHITNNLLFVVVRLMDDIYLPDCP